MQISSNGKKTSFCLNSLETNIFSKEWAKELKSCYLGTKDPLVLRNLIEQTKFKVTNTKAKKCNLIVY